MQEPNILILMPDQFRADCLSCTGHPQVRTPNLDRLAAEGIRFTRAYTSSPICMPARSSCLTGLYSHNHGQWGNYGQCPPEAPSYARKLREAGWHTCYIGKGHLYAPRGVRHLSERLPFMRALGWEEVLETTGPLGAQGTGSILTDHWREAGCLQTFLDDYAKRAAQPGVATWPSPLPAGEHLDGFIGRTALQFLSTYNRPKPFCAFIGFGGPHDPWDPPGEWARLYQPENMAPAQAVTEPGPWVPAAAAAHQRHLQDPAHPYTGDLIARVRALYYAKISHIDWWIGQILDELRHRRLLEQTVVLFWSDHGEMLGDKGRFRKSNFYEPSVRVPLLLRLPGTVSPGQICDSLVSIVDLSPTLLELAGVPAERCGFGHSLAPLLRNSTAQVNDCVFSEIDGRTMVCDGRFKLVIDEAATVLKLYDLGEDPEETENLVGKGGTEGVVVRLRERLLTWLLGTQWKRQ